MDTLEVYLAEQLVGILQREDSSLSFNYTESYLSSTGALPLSRHLPLVANLPPQVFGDETTRAFFENLLPEGSVRNQVARALGLSRGNSFDLLAALGGDCAGAVSLVIQGKTPQRQAAYRLISKNDLAEELAQLPSHPFLADEDGVRLSLAGAQNKLPIYFNGKKFFIPEGNAPSSHIIKTPIVNLENTVVNEAFCMNLAARVGLNVPHATVIEISGSQFYLMERYDRLAITQDKFKRLHQEDFCQALGVPPERKYEKEGGPGFSDCFALLREWSSEPFPDVAALLNWTLFNFLIGNADAHGKNISFLYADGQVRIAPFYDLISTAVYERQVNNKFAMQLGGAKDPRYLLAQHLDHFADEVGISRRAVIEALRVLTRAFKEALPTLVGEYRERFSAPGIITRLEEVLGQRVAKAVFLLQ